MLTVQSYIDDSDSHDGLLCLAAVGSTAEKWAAFSDAWDDALKAPPRIGYFKMQEAASLKGEFTGFNHARRKEKLGRLLSIMSQYIEYGAAITVDTAFYKEVFPEKFAASVDSPHVRAYLQLLAQIVACERRLKRTSKIDFIFDSMHETTYLEIFAFFNAMHSGEAMMPNWFREKFGNWPIVRDDKDVLPLQAADMIAWGTQRLRSDIRKGLQKSESKWDLISSLDLTMHFEDWDRNKLTQMHNEMIDDRWEPYETKQKRSARLKHLRKGIRKLKP